MRTIDLLQLSTRMFRVHTLRTALTILGVSVGIGTIVFLVSLGFGLQSILIEDITTSDSLLSLDVSPPESQAIKLDEDALDTLRNVPGVDRVVPLQSLAVQVTYKGSTGDVTGYVARPDYFVLSGIQPEHGALFAPTDSSGVVITSTLAELFELPPDAALGTPLSVSFLSSSSLEDVERPENIREAQVIGVVVGDAPALYMSEVFSISTGPREYALAKVKVENADALETVRNRIIEKGFSVLALSDIVDQANKIFNILQGVLAVFGAAALVVSAIGMVNTMTIAFLERTQEIGIMRSLGASRHDVFYLFLIESAAMGFLGGIGGLLVGFTGQFIIDFGLDLLARNLGGSSIDLFHTPLWFAMFIVIFSTFVGFFTGIIPGRRASRLNALKALKYK